MKRFIVLSDFFRSPKAQRLFKSSLFPQHGRFGMEAIISNLNSSYSVIPAGVPGAGTALDHSEMQLELRRLVRNWQASGPNLIELFKQDEALKIQCLHGRTSLLPTRTGRGFLSWRPDPKASEVSLQKSLALTHFMSLIVNPEWELLAGPCPRCNHYFLKKIRRQKIYCSRQCGAATTAVESTRKNRQDEHERRLRKAAAAVREWQRKGSKQDWKTWVSTRTGLTSHWLTRAVNRGELVPPKRQRSLP